MSRIVWVHEDCLDPLAPAFATAPGAPALFVFDDAVLRYRGLGLKRLGFVYECLLELPVTIRRGDTVETIRGFAAAHGATTVVTMASPCPELRRRMAAIGRGLELAVHAPVPLVDSDVAPDLGRFSRYWRAARASAMRRSVRPASGAAARPDRGSGP